MKGEITNFSQFMWPNTRDRRHVFERFATLGQLACTTRSEMTTCQRGSDWSPDWDSRGSFSWCLTDFTRPKMKKVNKILRDPVGPGHAGSHPKKGSANAKRDVDGSSEPRFLGVRILSKFGLKNSVFTCPPGSEQRSPLTVVASRSQKKTTVLYCRPLPEIGTTEFPRAWVRYFTFG